MAKRVQHTKIKQNLTYTMQEAADALGLSLATIRDWVKKGLPIHKDKRPFLIYGEELRCFIQKTQQAKRYKLADNQLSCFTCKAACVPHGMAVILAKQTAKTSRLSGICANCGGRCARIISNQRIPLFEQVLKIHFNGDQTP